MAGTVREHGRCPVFVVAEPSWTAFRSGSRRGRAAGAFARRLGYARDSASNAFCGHDDYLCAERPTHIVDPPFGTVQQGFVNLYLGWLDRWA